MKVTILGCAGSFPGADSPCSAYLIEAEGFRLLLDFGTGSLGTLQHYTGSADVDAIVLSHLHCDHIMDAASYVVVRRYHPDGPRPRLPLYGPAGTAERLGAIYGSEADFDGVSDVYDFRTLTPGVLTIGPFQIEVDRVNHPIETFGFRVEHEGRALAYSADTADTDALVRLARGADLLLCEASYLESRPHPPDLHLTGRGAGEHASKATVDRLVLTHLVKAWSDPELTLQEAKSAFDGSVELARLGAVYDLGK